MTDVYLYGMIAPSIVHFLRDDFAYPQANGYAEIARTLPSIGGEAANSAIVLARLGLTTRLDGCWINRPRAEWVTGTLAAYGIDVSRLTVVESGSTDEIVIADGHSRTVFGNYAGYHTGPRQWNEAQAEDIEDAAIVCLDPFFRDSAHRAAELCVERSKPYVTLDSPYDSLLARHAAAIAISHELRDQTYAGADMRDIFGRYLEMCEGLVIFTFGGDEIWYGRRGGALTVHQPYAIDPIDSTGAGDSFRGALAYGLLQGWPDERIVDFARAVAACVCMTVPHALNAPDLAGVQNFMARHR